MAREEEIKQRYSEFRAFNENLGEPTSIEVESGFERTFKGILRDLARLTEKGD